MRSGGLPGGRGAVAAVCVGVLSFVWFERSPAAGLNTTMLQFIRLFNFVAGSKAVKSEVACTVCGVLHDPQAKWCPSCSKIMRRRSGGSKCNKGARLDALKRAWRGSAFYCEITGWKLETNDHRSPFYLTWEHLTPGDETNVVVAAALINHMKANLTLDQFKLLVCALANRFANLQGRVPKIQLQRCRRKSARKKKKKIKAKTGAA